MLCLIVFLSLLLTPPLTGASTHVCVDSFATQSDLDALPFHSITLLIQSIFPLTITASGEIEKNGNDWYLPSLRDMAHGNGTKMWVGVKVTSKADAADFLSQPDTILNATAVHLVSLVVEANYDGFQIDMEGLRITSKNGFEMFVRACATAAHAHGISMTTTVYSLKFLEKGPSAYDPSLLSRLGEGMFIMG